MGSLILRFSSAPVRKVVGLFQPNVFKAQIVYSDVVTAHSIHRRIAQVIIGVFSSSARGGILPHIPMVVMLTLVLWTTGRFPVVIRATWKNNNRKSVSMSYLTKIKNYLVTPIRQGSNWEPNWRMVPIQTDPDSWLRLATILQRQFQTRHRQWESADFLPKLLARFRSGGRVAFLWEPLWKPPKRIQSTSLAAV